MSVSSHDTTSPLSSQNTILTHWHPAKHAQDEDVVQESPNSELPPRRAGSEAQSDGCVGECSRAKRGMTHLGLMPPQALVTTMWVAPMCRSTRIGIVARHSGCLASATGLGQRCCTPIAVRCGALSTE